MALIRQAEWSEGGREAVVHDLADLKRQAEHAHTMATEHAAGIVQAAMKERSRLLGDASEEGRAAGYAAGLEAGRIAGVEQGRREAFEATSRSLAEIEKRWLAALEEFDAKRDEMLAQSRRDVLTLALAIAERVVKRRIAGEASVAVDQVQAVLEKLSRPTRLTIHVNSGDLDCVREALPALTQRLLGDAHAELVADDSIERGSCVARSAGGEIDASIRTQLDRIAMALVPGQTPVVAKVADESSDESRPPMEKAA